MIPQGVQVFVALDPVDLRCSFDRLGGIAKEQVGYDARSGALFVFFGRRRDALKVLFFDGSEMCIFYKRLARRVFQLPEPTARRPARMLTYDGRTQSVSAWAREVGLPREALRNRLQRGMTVAKALETPLDVKKGNRRVRSTAGLLCASVPG